MLSTTDIVFAINKVPDIRPPLHSTVYFIANLQADNLPGSHWVAVRRLHNQGYYFDLFGRLPPMEIMAWLTANCSSWTYNLQCLQDKDDLTACGYLCIAFVTDLV